MNERENNTSREARNAAPTRNGTGAGTQAEILLLLRRETRKSRL